MFLEVYVGENHNLVFSSQCTAHNIVSSFKQPCPLLRGVVKYLKISSALVTAMVFLHPLMARGRQRVTFSMLHPLELDVSAEFKAMICIYISDWFTYFVIFLFIIAT